MPSPLDIRRSTDPRPRPAPPSDDLTPPWPGTALSHPYPAACRALLEFIETGDVIAHPPASACQAVARRLALDDQLMRDPVARAVVESYLEPPAPKTTPRVRR